MSPATDLPQELSRLFEARDPVAREDAWKGFVDQYSRLILHSLRRLGGEYDVLMDRYAFVLEQLSRDDYHRLRRYTPTGRGKFSTWLVVVVHRLGLDHHRRKYGSTDPSAAGARGKDQRVIRRRLADLLSEGLDVDALPAADAVAPDTPLREREFQTALEESLANLAPRDRLLLHLRYDLDLPARRIAELMKFPTPFHVYRRCNRLCDTLRAELNRRGVSDPIP